MSDEQDEGCCGGECQETSITNTGEGQGGPVTCVPDDTLVLTKGGFWKPAQGVVPGEALGVEPSGLAENQSQDVVTEDSGPPPADDPVLPVDETPIPPAWPSPGGETPPPVDPVEPAPPLEDPVPVPPVPTAIQDGLV